MRQLYGQKPTTLYSHYTINLNGLYISKHLLLDNKGSIFRRFGAVNELLKCLMNTLHKFTNAAPLGEIVGIRIFHLVVGEVHFAALPRSADLRLARSTRFEGKLTRRVSF